MSRFTPTTRTIEPADSPSELAEGVLHALARPIGGAQMAPLMRGVLVSILTFGLWPMLRWPGLFRDFIVAEQQQLWHFAQWLRLNSGHPDAARLVEIAEGLRPRNWLYLLAVAAAGAVIAVFYRQLYFDGALHLAPIIQCTWGGLHPYPIRMHGLFHEYYEPARRYLFGVWTIAISAGYFAHWFQVQLHASDVRRFIERFNRIAPHERVIAIVPETPGSGLGPFWLIAAVMLIALGGIWGVPMALAGGAHNRYIRRASARNRMSLAHRLREILLEQRPPIVLAEPVCMRPHCARPRCGAEAPRDATFCPRCGSRLPKTLGNTTYNSEGRVTS